MPRGNNSSKSNGNEKQLGFATVEQIAQIQALENDIHALVKQINSPYSTVASILLFPALFSFLFLKKYSPFHGTYEQAFQNYYDKFHAANVKKISEYYPTQLINGFDFYITHLENLCDYSVTCRSSNRNPCDYDQVMDEFEPSEVAQMKALEFKPQMLTLYNNLIANFDPSRIIPSEQALKMSFKTLYRLLKDNKKITKKFYELTTDDITQFEVAIEMDKLVITGKVMLAMLGKEFVVNPFFNRCFSNGVGQPPKPKPHLQIDFLSQQQATTHRKILENHKKILQLAAKRNVHISRLLLLLIIPFALLYLWNLSAHNYPSAEIVLIFISMLGTALTNAVEEAREFYRNKTLNHQINRQYEILKEIFAPYQIDIQPSRQATLESSYFVLTCGKLDSISMKNLAKIVKNILLLNKLKLLEKGGNKLILPANQTIPIEKLKELLNNFIATTKKMKLLQAQINEIAHTLKLPREDFIFASSHSSNFELKLTCTMLLEKSEASHKIFINELNNLKSSNQISIEEEENFSRVTISGIEPFDNKNFNNIINAAKTIHAPTVTPVIAQTVYEHSQTTQTLFFQTLSTKPNKKPKKQAKNELADKPADESSKKTNNVTAGKIDHPDNWYSFKSKFFKNTCFVTTTLSQNDFPDEKSFNKFNEMLKKPRFVPKKGAQGFVFTNDLIRDSKTGEIIWSSIKAKFLGDLGDMRVYAKREITPTGHRCYVFSAVKLHAH